MVDGSTEKELRKFFEKEMTTLTKMRTLKHRHLIQAIAMYEKGGEERCFVFPWAPKGNLRQLWQRVSGPADRKDTWWALDQIKGLTDGLSKLHIADTRHGDVKPENILIFDGDTKTGPFLVVADVGIAKYHAFETSERKAKGIDTTNRTGTGRYEPPEIELYQPQTISRKYDSWSLGCVLLEFVIWLLHGSDGQASFEKERREAKARDRFWDQDDRGNPILHPVVERWIQMLRGALPERSALRDLLGLVARMLLVGSLDSRAYICEFLPELQRVYDSCSTDPSYLWNGPDMLLTGSRNSTVKIVNESVVPISQRVGSTLMHGPMSED